MRGTLLFLGLVFLLVGVAVSPFLLHGLDTGEEVVSVQQLAQGYRPSTGNLTLRGFLRSDAILEHSENGRATSLVIPVVSADWQPGQPVYAVLSTDTTDLQEVAALAASHEYKGVWRNILWEGVSDEERDFFEHQSQTKAHLVDDVIFLDWNASAEIDRWVSLGVLGMTLFLLGGFALFAWRKQRRSARPAA
jgi:hypothetical protein